MLPEIMLQRQMEVAGALRTPPKSPDELIRTRLVIKSLSTFITQISRLATKLQLPLEIVFQCLMQMGLGTDEGVAFDKQHRQGNVPMHQAKVLDRNAALNANNVAPRIREAVEPSLLDKHIQHCSELRALLRMKVEDGNDLSMARRAIGLAEEYLDYIFQASHQDPQTMMRLYLADDEASIRTLLGTDTDDSASNFGNSVSSAAGLTITMSKSLPPNLIRGLRDECVGVLDNIKLEFAKRQQALQNVCAWMQVVDQAVFDGCVVDILNVLADPLKTQLGDKRSIICRLACETVTWICCRWRNDFVATASPRSREVCLLWLGVLLGSVHVTVAIIAEATDKAARELVIRSGGANFVVVAILGALAKAAQPELRRKLLNYLVLCVVLNGQAAEVITSTATSVCFKLCAASEESCRKAARVLCCAIGWRGCSFASAIDPKVERVLQQERPSMEVILARGLVAVETDLLGYPTPSRASEMPSCESSSIARSRSSAESVGNSPNTASGSTSREPSIPKQPSVVSIHSVVAKKDLAARSENIPSATVKPSAPVACRNVPPPLDVAVVAPEPEHTSTCVLPSIRSGIPMSLRLGKQGSGSLVSNTSFVTESSNTVSPIAPGSTGLSGSLKRRLVEQRPSSHAASAETHAHS